MEFCRWGSVRYEHMFDSSGIPKGLAEMEPGPALAGFLASIDRDSLSGHDRVLLLRAERRQADHYQARVYATMNAVAESTEELDLELATDAAADEIRAALHLTRRSAEFQLGFARRLVVDYPQVWEALQSGLLDVPRAMVIVDQTSHLESEVRNRVVGEAMERASGQTTADSLRARLARLVITVDPDSAQEALQQGVTERRVSIGGQPGWDRQPLRSPITRRGNPGGDASDQPAGPRLAAKGESRSIDQLRADVFLDLLHGRTAGSGADRGTVDITVDLTTPRRTPRGSW